MTSPAKNPAPQGVDGEGIDYWDIATKMTQINAINHDLTAKTPEYSDQLKAEKNQGVKSDKLKVKSRSFDIKRAFDMATKAIKKGLISPSKFGLQKFVRKEFGVMPLESDLNAWQKAWQEAGLIEPSFKNGKWSYKLLINKD